MGEWLWRLLRIKRYHVHYRFPSKTAPGREVVGKVGPMFKYEADYCAAASNVRLPGFHWVEEVAA